jgi:hypothetical protein
MVNRLVADVADLQRAIECEEVAGPFHYRSRCLPRRDDGRGVVGVESCWAAVVPSPVAQLQLACGSR